MTHNTAPESASFAITFPNVIGTELKYPHELAPSDYVCAQIPDPRPILSWYFSVMAGGRAYEKFVHSAENRSQANVLTRDNFVNARNISALGFSYADVEDL